MAGYRVGWLCDRRSWYGNKGSTYTGNDAATLQRYVAQYDLISHLAKPCVIRFEMKLTLCRFDLNLHALFAGRLNTD